jgi:hypothetical protein
MSSCPLVDDCDILLVLRVLGVFVMLGLSSSDGDSVDMDCKSNARIGD